MKLKCIGGLANGKIVNVENHYAENDIVQVNATIEFSIINFEKELENFRQNKIPDSMIVPYYYYKITTISFSQFRKLKFLIPDKWTAEEAVSFALGA